MWNQKVSLYIDDNSIRLMVIQGQQIKKWAELKLEPGLIKGSIVVQETEVAARIRQLLKSQKVTTRKIILGFSALHSLTRPVTFPQLPKSMLAEAVGREARRVLPVPLDQLYLTWQNIPCSKGRTQVFIAAIPRKTADSLIKTLRLAGLVPSRMTIKPLALTKSALVNTCILVDVQPAEFDVVILSEGIAQPIRTITFPNEELSWEQKLDIIITDLDRTLKFFDTNNPEKLLNASVPIYVSGDLMGKPELQNNLSAKMGHPVILLSSRLKVAEQIDLARFMVNIAMSMKSSPAGREITFPVSNLNLLPAPYQPKPISVTRVVGIPGTVAILGLIIPLVSLMQNSSVNIEALQNEINTTNRLTNQRLAQTQELKKSITGLEQKMAVAKTTYDKLQNSINKLNTSQEIVKGDLIAALNRASVNVTLKSIHESDGNLTISGSAAQEVDVLSYAREMDLTGRYSLTTISSITIIPPKEETAERQIEFVLNLQRKG